MNDPIAETTIEVLGKPFQIKCVESQKAYLEKACDFLNEKVRYFRTQGILEFDKAVVIAALNIVHQFLTQETQKEGLMELVNQRLRDLHEKVDQALIIE